MEQMRTSVKKLNASRDKQIEKTFVGCRVGPQDFPEMIQPLEHDTKHLVHILPGPENLGPIYETQKRVYCKSSFSLNKSVTPKSFRTAFWGKKKKKKLTFQTKRIIFNQNLTNILTIARILHLNFRRMT